MSRPGDKPSGVPGGRSIRFVGGTAPAPKAPTRSGRTKGVAIGPLTIRTADGKSRVVSAAAFAASQKKRHLTPKERKVAEAKKRLEKLLAQPEAARSTSRRWEVRVRAAAREPGKSEMQVQALMRCEGARAPVDPRRR